MNMDMPMSLTTPWNSNLTYAIAWCSVLALPVLILTLRHLFIVLFAHFAPSRTSAPDSDEDDEDEGEHDQLSAAARLKSAAVSGENMAATTTTAAHTIIPQSPEYSASPFPSSQLPPAHISSPRWSFSRLENWVVNKASATLYLASPVHLVAGATLLALIFLSVLAVLLLYNDDLMLNSNRAGFLGLSCIPFLFAFTGKNSIISLLTGMSHHRLNQVHRFLGLCLFIMVSVHMGCMIHTWMPWKFLLEEQLATTKVRYGLATYSTLCLIVLTSLWPVRRFAYEVFVLSHTLFLVFLVLVGLHTPYAMRFTAAGIACYLLNVLTGWCVRTHSALAQATVFQDRLTRICMDKPIEHLPGQHLYICVPSMSLIQWHPFTISSTDHNSVTVHVRAVGGFTKKLCRWPENTQRRVMLAGPYGEGVRVGRGLDTEKVVFLAAGSGLAYVVPILMDLLHHRQRSNVANCPIEVVWCVRDPDEVQWFQEEIELALDAAQGYLDTEKEKGEDIGLIKRERQEARLRVKIHYTNLAFGDQESLVVSVPPTSPPSVRQELHSSTSSSTSSSAPTGSASTTIAPAKTTLNVPFTGDERVQWERIRLDVGSYVRDQIATTAKDQVLEMVACGPALMLTQVHNAVAAEESLSGCKVQLHTERFYL